MRAGKGYRIIYVGHEGHEEAVGTMAVAPDSIDRVQSVAEVDALDDIDQPVALLAQTTLSHRDWEGVAVAVKRGFPQVWTPGRSDLCFATTNRQAALMELAHRCDAIVVLGSANSSNTQALEQLAREAGCPRVYRVNGVDELPDDLAGIVGVTAGASAPEELVAEVWSSCDPVRRCRGGQHHRRGRVLPSAAQHPRPADCDRDASTVMLGGSLLDRPGMDDRSVGASDVLTALGAVSD